MNEFQKLLSRLEQEHVSQLQHKDLLIRELTSKLETLVKANETLTAQIDALSAQQQRQQQQPKAKARRTSSPAKAERILVRETPTVSSKQTMGIIS